jgi:hypothetical protein
VFDIYVIWEVGDTHPRGPSLKLLSLLDRKGLEAVIGLRWSETA